MRHYGLQHRRERLPSPAKARWPGQTSTMCGGCRTAGVWFSCQWRPDNEFETHRPEYDRALVQRGDITMWLAPDAIATWKAVGVGTRGGQLQYPISPSKPR